VLRNVRTNPTGGCSAVPTFFRSLLACSVFASCAIALSPSALSQVREPFHRLRERAAEFVDPGDDIVPVSEIDEVLIGYFGPSDGRDAATGLMWQAARAAINTGNQQGGFHGKPFRLVPVWSADPWGTGVAQLARLIYRDQLWAIVGGIDGPSTHLAEQVVAKARLPLISPVSTDTTSNLANVSWLFSLAPGDHLIAPALAAEIARRVGSRDWGILSSDEHDSRNLADELKSALWLRDQKISPCFQFVYRRSESDFSTLVRRTVDQNPAAVVVLADMKDTARLARLLRGSEYTGELFAGPCVGRRPFCNLAGRAAQGIVFPLLSERGEAGSSKASVDQAVSVVDDVEAWDWAADLTYDAVRLTVEAIRRGGLNRARIRQEIHEQAPWQGIAGTVRWDSLGSNTRRPCLATIVDGRVQPLRESP
jgi:branched-chain amino acid transport system substrate-binding protein